MVLLVNACVWSSLVGSSGRPSAMGVWLRWRRERREVQGNPRPRSNPDGKQASMHQSSQTVHSMNFAYRYSRGVGDPQGVGGAGAS